MAADDIESCKATCMECSVTSMLLEVNAVLGAYPIRNALSNLDNHTSPTPKHF